MKYRIQEKTEDEDFTVLKVVFVPRFCTEITIRTFHKSGILFAKGRKLRNIISLNASGNVRIDENTQVVGFIRFWRVQVE